MVIDQKHCGLNCNVLVLNKHYMAIRIIGARRAFSLLFRDLAEVVSLEEGRYSNYDFESWCEVSQFRRDFEPDGQDWVSTVNFHIAVPRIIRLLFYIQVLVTTHQIYRVKHLLSRQRRRRKSAPLGQLHIALRPLDTRLVATLCLF